MEPSVDSSVSETKCSTVTSIGRYGDERSPYYYGVSTGHTRYTRISGETDPPSFVKKGRIQGIVLETNFIPLSFDAVTSNSLLTTLLPPLNSSVPFPFLSLCRFTYSSSFYTVLEDFCPYLSLFYLFVELRQKESETVQDFGFVVTRILIRIWES